MQTKNAINNLVNRYKAVLKKCHVLNTLGSLAMVSMFSLGLSLGLAGGMAMELANPQSALAADLTNNADIKTDGSASEANDGTYDINDDQAGNDAYGGQAETTTTATGGNSASSTANNNTLHINANGFVNAAYGGSAWSEGNWSSSATGGAGGAATANANTLIIKDNKNEIGEAYGGSARSVGGNSSSGTGGAGGEATANYNSLSIMQSGDVTDAYGGSAWSLGGNSGYGAGGDAGKATVNNNALTIETSAYAYNAYGGSAWSRGGSNSDASNNGGAGDTATAYENTLTIDNSTVDQDAYGGRARSFGGESANATGGAGGEAIAQKNTLTAINSKVYINTYGGFAWSQGGESTTGTKGTDGMATASYNSVKAVDTRFGVGSADSGHIVGGMAIGNDNSRAENNSVTLSGNVQFQNANAIVAGGLLQDFDSGFVASPRAFSGNNMHFDNYTGNKIGTLGNFATYNFTLGAGIANGATIVQVGNLHLSDGASASASIGTIHVAMGSPLIAGNSVILIDYDNVTGTIANDNGTLKGQQGAFIEFTWEVAQSTDTGAGEITATIKGIDEVTPPTPTPDPDDGNNNNNGSGTGTTPAPVRVNNNANAIVGSAMGGMAQAQGVVDVATGAAAEGAQGAINEVLIASSNGGAHGGGLAAGSATTQKMGSAITTFATVAGGTMRYNNTDAHLDINALNLVSGLALGHRSEVGNLLVSAFFAGSTASYYTNDDTNSGTSIQGNGDSQSYGFGLLARYDFYTDFGTPYVEASFHHGQVRNEYYSDDVFDPVTYQSAGYDNVTNYTALHAGLGYIFNLGENSKLDVYGKYYYTQQNAHEFTVLEEAFAIDSMESQRLRLGARYSYDMYTESDSHFTFYGGLAFEHEFDGETNASIRNIDIDSDTSLQGSTYMGEVGMSFSPSGIDGLSFDVGVQGYLGKREGIMGKLGVRYEF